MATAQDLQVESCTKVLHCENNKQLFIKDLVNKVTLVTCLESEVTVRDLMMRLAATKVIVMSTCYVSWQSRLLHFDTKLHDLPFLAKLEVQARLIGGMPPKSASRIVPGKWPKTEEAAKLAQKWSDDHGGNATVCAFKYIEPDQLPPSVIALVQALIDSHGFVTAPMVTTIWLKLKDAWKAYQSVRYREYLDHFAQDNRKKTGVSGSIISPKLIETLLVLFGDEEAPTKAGWKTISNQTQTWIKRHVQRHPKVVKAEFRWQFRMTETELPATITGTTGASGSTQKPDDLHDNTVISVSEDENENVAGDEMEEGDEDPDDTERIEHQLSRVQFDPASQDPETFFDELEAAFLKAIAKSSSNLSKVFDRSRGTKLYYMQTWTPQIETSEPQYTKEGCIDAIRSRLIRQIWANGRGYHKKRDEVTRQVDLWIKDFLSEKTYEQLRVIDNIPHLPLTPQLLKLAGFKVKRLEMGAREKALIYLKFVPTSKHALQQMAASQHRLTPSYARDALEFVERSTPDHLLGMQPQLLSRTDDNLFVTHCGRLSVGIDSRRSGENVEILKFDVDRGARPWVEATHLGGGSHNIEYYLLETHDEKCGEAWSAAMGWGEVLWSHVFSNPLLSNIAYPGLDLPAPPLYPGGRVNSHLKGSEAEAERRAYAANLRRSHFDRKLDIWEVAADGVTRACLQMMHYDGNEHPRDFINRFHHKSKHRSPPSRGCGIIFGLGVITRLPYHLVIMSGSMFQRNDCMRVKKKVYVADGSQRRDRLILRPAGTCPGVKGQANPLGHCVKAMNRYMLMTVPAIGSYFVESLKNAASRHHTMDLVFTPAFAQDDKTMFNLHSAYDESQKVMRAVVGHQNSRTGRFLEISLQPEAAALLRGEAVPEMDVDDLFFSHFYAVGVPLSTAQSTSTITNRRQSRAARLRQLEARPPLPENLLSEWEQLGAVEALCREEWLESFNKPFHNMLSSSNDVARDMLDSDNASVQLDTAVKAIADFRITYDALYMIP